MAGDLCRKSGKTGRRPRRDLRQLVGRRVSARPPTVTTWSASSPKPRASTLPRPSSSAKSELRGYAARPSAATNSQTNFPDPWPGGWWRLRDIIDYEKITAAKSLFTLAARYHEHAFRKTIRPLRPRSRSRSGQNEPPYAWLVPPDQRDPRPRIRNAGAIGGHRHRSASRGTRRSTADGVDYPEGTFIMYCAQPYRPHLMDMMERQVYPDRVIISRRPSGTPLRHGGMDPAASDGRASRRGERSFPSDDA